VKTQGVVGQFGKVHNSVGTGYVLDRHPPNVTPLPPIPGCFEAVVKAAVGVEVGVEAADVVPAGLEMGDEAGANVAFVPGNENGHESEELM
jgi:hypothetical protein